MWEFQDIRKQAIEVLSTRGIGLATKAAIAAQYGIPRWLLEAYEGLLQRQEGISVAEAQELGLENAIKLYQIREENDAKRRKYYRTRTRTGLEYQEVKGSFDRSDDDCKELLRKEFPLSLAGKIAEESEEEAIWS